MAFDKRLSRPEDYLDEVSLFFHKGAKGPYQINYEEAFRRKSDEPPFTVYHFDSSSLQERLKTKKLSTNPRAGFVDSQNPENFEAFTGLGRFDTGRNDPENPLYSFKEGRANTKLDFRTYPDFKERWVEMYELSPTLSVDKKVSNPNPRISNPDPEGNLMAYAQKKAENQLEGKMNVAQLLSSSKKEIKKAEEPQKERTAQFKKQEQKKPNKITAKTKKKSPEVKEKIS
tara:strand:- start:12763 stop:13449 length:687 start_codon:yes stop_codon:yes gene_type:complete